MRAALTSDNKIDIVRALYETMPVKQEVPNMSASAFSKQVGVSPNQMDRLLRRLEAVGILSRRTTMGIGGRVGIWTLNVSKDEALKRVDNIPSKASHSSLRKRLLSAIQEHGKFDSVADILTYIKADPAENIDYHNVTHLLTALREQGKVSFKRDNSGRKRRGGRGNQTANVPYDIEIGKMHVEPTLAVVPEPVALPDPEPRPEPEPEPVSITQPVAFPLIQRVVLRREFLERAALLAEQADETDLALSLLEKAKDSLSDYDKEVISLWNAYQDCKS